VRRVAGFGSPGPAGSWLLLVRARTTRIVRAR
jgi:hypothetical protein